MKIRAMTILVSILLLSCKKEPGPKIDYCNEAIMKFKTYTSYEGTINFCNAQPPLMSFIPAVATTTFIDSNTLQVHLQADSIHWDTLLTYDIHCSLAEEIIPIITLTGETIHDDGNYTHSDFREDYTASLTVRFGYPNCLTNTGFEGLGK